MCETDGISVMWAPRHDIVTGLLEQDSTEDRQAYLVEQQGDILDDVEKSLAWVTDPELADWAVLLGRAVEAQRAGHGEAAQALAANVLDSALQKRSRVWLEDSFPQITFPHGSSHNGALKKLNQKRPEFDELTIFAFSCYLTTVGMISAFAPQATRRSDLFNRHAAAHEASLHTYQPSFALPVVLLAHGLLRKLQHDLSGEE